jgi:hypothetical protein
MNSQFCISFKRNGVRVQVNVESLTGVEKSVFPFSYSCSDEADAEIITRHFQRIMSESLTKIRTKEYERGFEDGKRKKRKETWFSGWWGV